MDSLSKFKHVLIKVPASDIYQAVTPIRVYELTQRASTLSSDLVLGSDRYPEYLLIKHLPSKNIFEYFTNQTN